MKLLLDTHVILWAAGSPRLLSRRVRELLLDPQSELLASGVSAAELSIKGRTGRLDVGGPVSDFWRSQRRELAWTELQFTAQHGLEVAHLPRHHNDPFDWMLIAQSRVEGIALVTSDRDIRRYDVETVW